MNTTNPSPLVPQGTLPDNRGKSRVQFTVLTILAVHAVVLGVVLLQGCKRTAVDPNLELQALATNYPPPEAVAPPPMSTPPPQVAQIPQAPLTPVDTQPAPVSIAPPPEPAPISSPAAASQHVVVSRDSFSTIARKYGVTVRAVAEANPGVDSTRLRIGQKLAVPSPAVRTASGATGSGASGGEAMYVVRSGDTLSRIARTHGTTAKALRSVNHLRTDQIKVGQKLVIPTKNGAPAVESGVGGTGSLATPLP